MAFGQDFLQGFFGSRGLKDYAHASKTFRTNGYELAPRNKFLYHVYFTLNTSQIPTLGTLYPRDELSRLGLLVKNIQLPSFSIETETLNQYNRKRIIQKKVNYNPIQVEFHDDTGDLSRNLWQNYFAYYYMDSAQQYLSGASSKNGSIGSIANEPGFAYNKRDIYSNNRPVNDWGFIGEGYTQGSAGGPGGNSGGDVSSGKPPFFTDIRIFGMSQHKFATYILVNPVIKEWRHDTYDYAQGNGTMTNVCTLEYETVKYYDGAIGRVRPDTNVTGFADPAYYDTIKSSLARPGSTSSVLGQGGLLDAGIGIIEDLSSGGPAGVLGAIQTAGTAYNTFKGKNLKSIVNEEANQAIKDVLRNVQPGAVRQQLGGTSQLNATFPRNPAP
jgi:hypothetical protein